MNIGMQIISNLIQFARDPSNPAVVEPLTTTIGKFPPFRWSINNHIKRTPLAPQLARLTRQPIPYDALADMPTGSYGYELHYWRSRWNVPQIENSWLKIEPWPLARFLKFHDMMHAIANIPPTVTGEIQMQAFLRGTGRPDLMAKLSVVSNALLAWNHCGLLFGGYAEWRGKRDGRKLQNIDLLMFPYELVYGEQMKW